MNEKETSNLSKTTSAYPMIDVKICPVREFTTVPDLATGGRRKRRYAMTLSMTAIPNFSEQSDTIMLPVSLDTVLLDSDSISALEERAIQEVKNMILQLREALENKENGTTQAAAKKDSGIVTA